METRQSLFHENKMADGKPENEGKQLEKQEKPKGKKKQTLGRQCAAYGCNNRGLKKLEGGDIVPSGISFFTFPETKKQNKVLVQSHKES